MQCINTTCLVSQICIDMSVFGVLHIMAFFSWMTLVEGGTWRDIKAKVRQDFLPTYCAAMLFWPIYMAFVFSQVPVPMQLLAVNLGCLVDATFMCWCELKLKAESHWVDAAHTGCEVRACRHCFQHGPRLVMPSTSTSTTKSRGSRCRACRVQPR